MLLRNKTNNRMNKYKTYKKEEEESRTKTEDMKNKNY